MITKYEIHFTDNYGQGAIDCYPDELPGCLKALRECPEVEDIWVESFDTEEGWQA